MITHDDFSKKISADGWVLFEQVVDELLIAQLKKDLESAYLLRHDIQKENGITASTKGTAHHLLIDGKSFLEFLEKSYLDEFIKLYFNGNYILNAFGGNPNEKSDSTYANKIHVDSHIYSKNFKLQLNMLVMLEDFTSENGATPLLSGSHLTFDMPDEDRFFENAVRVTGKAGGIILWDADLWHAAGNNRTNTSRKALSLIFSRPFVKQQFDYVNFFVNNKSIDDFSEYLKQILGYYSRVPATLNEWYQPPELRCYRPDQDIVL